MTQTEERIQEIKEVYQMMDTTTLRRIYFSKACKVKGEYAEAFFQTISERKDFNKTVDLEEAEANKQARINAEENFKKKEKEGRKKKKRT